MDEDISLRELARTLADFRNEYRIDRTLYVRTDLYGAQRDAMLTRIDSLEKETAANRDKYALEWTQVRSSIRTGFISAGFAILVTVVIALLT